MRANGSHRVLLVGMLALALASVSCGGGSSSNSRSSQPSNVQAIDVDTGPTAQAGFGSYINGAFTSVTVCAPGTNQCQTIGGVLVDTGSEGLRILSSALTLSLPQQNDANGNPVVECTPFAGTVAWGPVQTADVKMAGETAGSVPVQVIGTSNFSTVPSACNNQGTPTEDLQSLGANGILGVGPFAQDCGPACAPGTTSNAGFYYSCPSSNNCSVTTESLSKQVTNPVVMFPTDNNGVIIELPSVPDATAELSLSGTMIFGIGTRSNNSLGNATVFLADPNTGNFTTTYNGTAYQNAFIDSGSNALYFLDSTTTNLPTCSSPNTFWYCPSANVGFSATIQGTNGVSGTVNFTVGNADTLVANSSDGVANGLAGPSPNTFDWGLPFFFGRNVFTAIEGQSAPGGSTPYYAY